MPITELAIVPDSKSEPMSRAEEKPISAYILRVMKEEGWSQADVLKNATALKIHLRQATFSEILTGETEDPRIFTLIDISRALHRPFEEMLEAIQGAETANSSSFSQSEFALMNQVYERLNKQQRSRADDLINL